MREKERLGVVNLRVTWFSGRSLDSDLAASTEMGLGKALCDHGVYLHFVSPSVKRRLEFSEQTSLKNCNFPGMKAISGGLSARKIIKENPRIMEDSDVNIIDWRLVPTLNNSLRRSKIPWLIIDRGPPAYDGILAKAQKILWKRAWSISEEHSSGGFVVSEKHAEYVRKYTGATNSTEIRAITAGTDVRNFPARTKGLGNIMKIVYIGRVDRNRGIDGIFPLVDVLEKENIRCTIYIAGEGNMISNLKSRAMNDGIVNLQILGKLERKDVWDLLERCHVGIMPMPNSEIWMTSSPLKLAEYAAAGLLTIGPNHAGNRISEGDLWSILSDEENWQEDCVGMLLEIWEGGDWGLVSSRARESAQIIDWGHIAEKLIEDLKELSGANR